MTLPEFLMKYADTHPVVTCIMVSLLGVASLASVTFIVREVLHAVATIFCVPFDMVMVVFRGYGTITPRKRLAGRLPEAVKS